MPQNLRIGCSANSSGAHTRQLTQAFADACRWLEWDADLIWAEDGRDPAMAKQAAAFLAEAGVSIVVGHLSAAAALAALPVYIERDIAFIAPATSHLHFNHTRWPGALRAFGTDDRTAQTMVDIRPPGAAPAIVFHRQTYGAALAEELQARIAACGPAPRLIACPHPLSGFEAPVAASELYVAGIHEFCADVIIEARRQGFGRPIAVGDDCFTERFVELCGPSANGVLIATQLVASQYGLEPEDAGRVIPAKDITGYYAPCLIAFAVALQAAISHPDLRGAALGNVMRETRWATPYGVFNFNAAGDLAGLADSAFEVREGGLKLRRFEIASELQVHGA